MTRRPATSKWASPASIRLRAEAGRTRWAARYLPVAPVIDDGSDGTVEWLVTAAITGRPASDSTLGPREDIIVAWANGLRHLHERAPVRDCPFDVRLDHALEHVRRRVAAGAVDSGDDFHDEHLHLRTAAAALTSSSGSALTARTSWCVTATTARRTPCSTAAGSLVTSISGELAVADRWWDLAVGTWSTSWNFGPGLESLFLAAYGARPDPHRQAFYRLLFDLAS